jgi:hypothetical protein
MTTPTAKTLLAQADQLMRRSRSPEDLPVLTELVRDTTSPRDNFEPLVLDERIDDLPHDAGMIPLPEVEELDPRASYEVRTAFSPARPLAQPTPSFTQPTPSFTQPTPSFTQPTPSFTQPTPSFTQSTSSSTQPTPSSSLPSAPSPSPSPHPPQRPSSLSTSVAASWLDAPPMVARAGSAPQSAPASASSYVGTASSRAPIVATTESTSNEPATAFTRDQINAMLVKRLEQMQHSVYSQVMQQLELHATGQMKENLRAVLVPALSSLANDIATQVAEETSNQMQTVIANAVENEVARLREQLTKKRENR